MLMYESLAEASAIVCVCVCVCVIPWILGMNKSLSSLESDNFNWQIIYSHWHTPRYYLYEKAKPLLWYFDSQARLWMYIAIIAEF